MDKILFLTLLLIGVSSFVESYPASSRQLLPHRPGYVPVYIRNGDTPLEDINLDLAEAFHAIPSGRSAGKNEVEALPQSEDKKIAVVPTKVEFSDEKTENKAEVPRTEISVEKVNENPGKGDEKVAKEVAEVVKDEKAQ